MNLFRVLIDPRSEEREFPERLEVATAANLLDVGEFQILEMAYREWYGREMPPAVVSHVFRSYMYRSVVPHWARHYARRVAADSGRSMRRTREPEGRPEERRRRDFRRTLILTAVIGAAFGAAVSIPTAEDDAISALPPAFTEDELPGPGATR